MSKEYAINYHKTLAGIANAVGTGLKSAASYSGQAAAKANGATAASQSAQGAFNQGSANIANGIATDRIGEQYEYNSGQAASANAFTESMWERAAAWNREMMELQMQFNREEAQKNRDWQERMDSTKYARAVKDMESSGLNPVLAVTGGGISTGAGSGSAASVSAPSMGGASGAMASGGLLQGVSASEGMGSGQMEYMGGLLGLLSAGMSGLSSAIKAFAEMGLNTKDVGDVIIEIMTGGGDNVIAQNARGHSQEKADLYDKNWKEKIKQGIEAITAYKGGTTANEWYKRKGYLK